MIHECNGMTATPATSPAITYTLGTGPKTINLNAAFSYSTGAKDYCFTYTIYDTSVPSIANFPLTPA